MVTRRKFTSAFKAKVVRETLKEQQTSAELAKRFEISPSLICQWKNEVLENLNNFFEGKYHLSNDDQIKHHVHVLEQKVGQLTIERDFLEQGYEKLGISKKKF